MPGPHPTPATDDPILLALLSPVLQEGFRCRDDVLLASACIERHAVLPACAYRGAMPVSLRIVDFRRRNRANWVGEKERTAEELWQRHICDAFACDTCKCMRVLGMCVRERNG